MDSRLIYAPDWIETAALRGTRPWGRWLYRVKTKRKVKRVIRFLDDRPAGGPRDPSNVCVDWAPGLSASEEANQVPVELVGVRGIEPVRGALDDNQLRVGDRLRGPLAADLERDDGVGVAVDHQCRDRDFL